jgi:hypothetical protein
MTLATLIRKREAGKSANDNSAKVANDGRATERPLAGLAALALANSPDERTANLSYAACEGDTATASRRWPIRDLQQPALEAACSPAVTDAGILVGRPGAVAAASFPPIWPQPIVLMTQEEETAIRAWLAHIDETDPATIAEVVDKCRADLDERKILLRWAKEVPRPLAVDDDRRRCDQCANLTERGLCLAARRGEINATRIHEPVRDLPQRCVGYMPKAADTDQRPGRERWPGLIQKGDNRANT